MLHQDILQLIGQHIRGNNKTLEDYFIRNVEITVRVDIEIHGLLRLLYHLIFKSQTLSHVIQSP
jgi:hypothetical protein